MKNINSKQIEKEFNKLSQLDRIEFRQKMFMVKNRFKNPLFFISKYYLIGGFALMLYSILVAPNYGDALFLSFFKIGLDALKIGLFFLVLEYIAFLYIFWKSHKDEVRIIKEHMPKLFEGDKK